MDEIVSIDRRLFHFLSILFLTEPSTFPPFLSICVDLEHGNIFPSTFLEKFTVRSNLLFRKANKHTAPIFLFQGSDKRSIDLAEDKDWCLRGDRVRCQLSGTRTGRHFRERYAAWRFGTVSNLPYGYQVINFIETFQFRIDLLYQVISNEFIFFFRSMILSRRINDDDHRDGFTKWPFMTTHTWGEYPQGNWLLEV